MSIANQGFPAFREDLNNALPALASNNAGATEPSAMFAHQWWVDTSATPNLLKQRNADNDAWITVGSLDQSADTFTLAAGSAGAFTTLSVSSAVSDSGSLTSTNAANSLVRRDAGGGFSAGIISATRFDGPLNGTLGVAAANTIKATTITASGIITSTIASGSGENFSTAGQATLSIAQSGNALLLSGSGYYLVSISEVLQTGNSGVYVLANGSVIFLGGIGFVATTTTPTNNQISIAFSGGNYRVYIGHTTVATYGIKATIIRQH
jgi:hypothetical protein